MVAVLISGGAIEEEFAVGFLDKCKADQIIAVDRGLTFCKRYGIRPNCIVGDFDSLPGGILEEYEKDTDIMIKRLIPEKDDSDASGNGYGGRDHLSVRRRGNTVGSCNGKSSATGICACPGS